MPAPDLFPTPTPPPPPGGIELAPGVRIPEDLLRLQYARSSGPGGQNVNKVNTKAELWAAVDAMIGLTEPARARLVKLAGSKMTVGGEIHIAADNRRSQEMNRAEVFDRLRELIVTAMHEPRRRRKTKPSKRAKQRRIDDKKRRGDVKSNRRYSG